MLKATGKCETNPANETVAFAGRQFAGLRDEWLEVPFALLEVAYLTSRQIMLAKQGITVQQGVSPQPAGGSVPVPHDGLTIPRAGERAS